MSFCSQRGVEMTYSPYAEELRRCRATKRDGTPCQAWAVWGEPDGLCVTHSPRHKTGPGSGDGSTRGLRVPKRKRTAYPPCTCLAYEWPHRPGGGICEWPNLNPRWRCTIPQGTRSDFAKYMRSRTKAYKRSLKKPYKRSRKRGR